MSGQGRAGVASLLVVGLAVGALWPIGTASASRAAGTYLPPATVATVALDSAQGIATDTAGNVFVSDNGDDRVLELPKKSNSFGPAQVLPFTGLHGGVGDVAVDGTGDVFVADVNQVYELPKTSTGYGPSVPLPVSGVTKIYSLAADQAGSVYLAANGNEVIKLPKTAAGYGPQVTLPFSDPFATGLTVDRAGDVFIVGSGMLSELPATPGGYGPQSSFPSVGIGDATSMTIGASGTIFVGSTAVSGAVWEVPKTATGWGPAQTTYLYFYGAQVVSALAVDAVGDLLATGSTDQGYFSEAVRLPAADLKPSSRKFGSTPATALPLRGINSPTGVAVDSQGHIFVADSSTPAFETKDPSYRANVLEFPKKPGQSGHEIVASIPQLSVVDGLAVDGAGDVYVAKVGALGAEVWELPKVGGGFGPASTLPFGQVDGTDVTASAVAVDAAGDVFMSWDNDDGESSGLAELPALPGGYGPTIELPFYDPIRGLAVDNAGDLFAAVSSEVIELAKGTTGYGAHKIIENGSVQGYGPFGGIAVDRAGDVVAAAPTNGTVIEIPFGPGGYGTPTALSSTGISQPDEVAVDKAGDVLVAGPADVAAGRYATVTQLRSH